MIKRSDYLPDDAKKIREEVFVVEQGFTLEFDNIDSRAVHLVLYVDEKPAAACRYYSGDEKGIFWLGRIAVRKPFRGNHVGEQMLLAAEEEIQKDGGTAIWLSAQVRVREFYEKCGYKAIGEVYSDEGCPHICMKKEL